MNDRLITLAALVLLAGCIDVEGGKQGTYGSPCGTFGGVLLCGRESGGADPQRTDGGPGGAATCVDACEVIVACSFGEQDMASCVFGCEAEDTPQSFLDCVVASGCDFGICFGPIT